MMAEPDAGTKPPARGCRRPWAEEGRVFCAEALGTALLVLLSCLPRAPPGAAGAVVAMLVQCFDHVSGAMFNPTVVLAGAVWGRVPPRRALAMLAAQLAGAAWGAAVLLALTPAADPVTRPAAGLPPWAAACLEGVGGACLALVNCASWDPRNAHLRDSWPLRIGATVAALSLVTTELTGASFNPARSAGPALVVGGAAWRHHWVYWAGPLAGSLAATTLYIAVWRPRAPPARALPPPAPAPGPAALAH